jgi:hypothetical protein
MEIKMMMIIGSVKPGVIVWLERLGSILFFYIFRSKFVLFIYQHKMYVEMKFRAHKDVTGQFLITTISSGSISSESMSLQ